MTDGEIDTCVIRRPQGTRGSASEKQCQMGKKEGATTDEKRKQRSGGLKAAIWFRRRRRQGCGRMQVAIWSYFLVDFLLESNVGQRQLPAKGPVVL